ncbi:helix-turn-helix domain-containing protein [Dyadobacter sp. OTU695]|uniref:helix-turn-helix domain-containing protein n=1 Tax=Dyadobacter sp. OTU695 TaxID=3043860 RepID=UPI00313BFEE4
MKTITETKPEQLDELLNAARKTLAKAQDYLSKDGKIYELHDWVTVAEYCRRFNISNTQTVSNWIKRGIIPAEDTVVIEEYNNIRLIKAIAYQDKKVAHNN